MKESNDECDHSTFRSVGRPPTAGVQPVATVVSGMDSMKRLRENLAIAKSFKPLTEEEQDAIRSKCAQSAPGGEFEPYKEKENA